LHVESRTWCSHVIVRVSATHMAGLCVYLRNICSSRMRISIARQGEIVRGIGTVREAGFAIRGLRDVTGIPRATIEILAILTDCARILLHAEQMSRQDKAVPHER